jgi:hypothetical protein
MRTVVVSQRSGEGVQTRSRLLGRYGVSVPSATGDADAGSGAEGEAARPEEREAGRRVGEPDRDRGREGDATAGRSRDDDASPQPSAG